MSVSVWWRLSLSINSGKEYTVRRGIKPNVFDIIVNGEINFIKKQTIVPMQKYFGREYSKTEL